MNQSLYRSSQSCLQFIRSGKQRIGSECKLPTPTFWIFENALIIVWSLNCQVKKYERRNDNLHESMYLVFRCNVITSARRTSDSNFYLRQIFIICASLLRNGHVILTFSTLVTLVVTISVDVNYTLCKCCCLIRQIADRLPYYTEVI